MNSPTLHNNTPHTPMKWTVFTYYNPSIHKITNLFRKTGISTAFRNNNTVHDILKLRMPDTADQYTKSGIYKLTCTTCECSYVGQTGRLETNVFRTY
jgi:hypothetical protein